MSEIDVPREWRLYVEDMIVFCDKVLSYMEGVDSSAFTADPMRYDAVLRNLELVGEAATRVPEHIRTVAPDVPWRMIVATKNKLIHGYLGIDKETIWSIVSDDLVPLRDALLRLLARTT